MRIREGHGVTRNLFQCGANEQCEDQRKKVFSSKICGYWLKILAIFHKFLSEDKKKKKKRSSVQKFYETRCESTKITKIRAVNTNLGVSGLDLHSNSLEPLNFFGGTALPWGALFSFGGCKLSFEGTAPECPPPWRWA